MVTVDIFLSGPSWKWSGAAPKARLSPLGFVRHGDGAPRRKPQ